MSVKTDDVPEISDAEERIKLRYWKKMCQFKFDIFYYSNHFSRCIRITRFLKIMMAVLTALFTGMWMNNNNAENWINTFCPIAILILQVINVGIEFLPFEKRKLELRELLDKLEPLYNQVEAKWVKIANGEIKLEDIENETASFISKKEEISKNFFKDDFLPQRKSIKKKSQKQADEYFYNL